LRRSRRLLCTSLAAFALAASSPRVARADDADPVSAYRDAVARASDAFDAGEYEAAREGFQEAYEIHAEPVLLFNIASTYRREGDLDHALDAYRAFLAAAGRDDQNRALAEETVADLEDQLEARSVKAPISVPPPVVHPDEPELPGPSSEHPRGAGLPRADELMRWGGIACGAASLVTLGAAIVAARESSQTARELEALPNGHRWDQEEQDLYAHGNAARTQAIVWSIATAALAGTGVALYIYGDRRHAALTLTPSSDGALMSYAGSF
jgi:tetratricopeptide (TPR) repeat protein